MRKKKWIWFISGAEAVPWFSLIYETFPDCANASWWCLCVPVTPDLWGPFLHSEEFAFQFPLLVPLPTVLQPGEGARAPLCPSCPTQPQHQEEQVMLHGNKLTLLWSPARSLCMPNTSLQHIWPCFLPLFFMLKQWRGKAAAPCHAWVPTWVAACSPVLCKTATKKRSKKGLDMCRLSPAGDSPPTFSIHAGAGRQ